MRKDLKARQERMKQRQLAKQKTVTVLGYVPPAAAWNPIDYSEPVEYSSEVAALQYFPLVPGVYLLTVGGRFYVGQSVDVYARFSSHRLKPINCRFRDPKGAVLAAVPFRADWTWNENARVRLNAEARFIAAALSLDLPLTNALSAFKRAKLLRLFPDLQSERDRIEKALKILC